MADMRTWQGRFVEGGPFLFVPTEWTGIDGRNERDAAERLLQQELYLHDYQEWKDYGCPEKLIVEIRKSETAKKVMKILLTPQIDIDWSGTKMKES